MGNQVTRERKITSKKAIAAAAANANANASGSASSNTNSNAVTQTNSERRNSTKMTRSPSGADIEHKPHMQFLPIDRLAKILSEHSQKEEAVHGITKSIFQKYLFPHYPTLADHLFSYLHHLSKATTMHLGVSAFKQQTERFLSVMNDVTILENYIKMFSTLGETYDIVPESLKELLMVSYKLAVENSNTAKSCLDVDRITTSVLSSCFHGKNILSASYVSNWVSQHCPRLVEGVHRYVVHILTTAYRNGSILISKEIAQPHWEFSTPVLEKSNAFDEMEPFLPSSYAWLLSTSLPLCYIQETDARKEEAQDMVTRMSGTSCPSHWTLLYNSQQHGAGSNRFLHHVLGYKGPTLLFIRGATIDKDDVCPTYCVCTAVEWRETHLYWGNEDSMIIELIPNYRVVQKGAKLLYLNTNIRGYPQGLRAGDNPRNPCVNIDQSFSSVTLSGMPYRIASLEVWGCGDTKSRERQLEIKKWQVKEAEKQRIVKLSATDWLDHPDRYLLELGGRQSYNTTGS